MRRFPLGELKLREGHLKDKLERGWVIFVGSSCDMWAKEVPMAWIAKVLNRCREFPQTTFLFQSKNPARLRAFVFPPNTILGTTLESNRYLPHISLAPPPHNRICAMRQLPAPKMVSIEPIMDFDLDCFVKDIQDIAPEFVSIGADSKGHGLPEPSADKLLALIAALEEFTEVRQKANLKRLTQGMA